jgi:hypothetical protein
VSLLDVSVEFVVVELVVVVTVLVVVVVEPTVETVGVAVVVGSGTVGRVGRTGKVVTPGSETVCTIVVTQPTTGRQSCGAAGALLANALATRMPAAKIPLPAMMRIAVPSLWRSGVGRREVMRAASFV